MSTIKPSPVSIVQLQTLKSMLEFQGDCVLNFFCFAIQCCYNILTLSEFQDA